MANFQRYVISIVLIIYFNISNTFVQSLPDTSELRLVSAVFRHGDRTMDRSKGETYPKDPHKDYDCYPMGEGQLTNVGKMRSYQLGKILRERYNSFLGDVYYQPNVYARSTAFARCKMTLQLVLAALYPPPEIQRWDSKLNWQPMNTLYTPLSQDGLLLTLLCPKYQKAYENNVKNPEVKKKVSQFNDLMKMTSFHTGKNFTTTIQLYLLYQTFATQLSLGLSLPEWTKDIFPNGKLLELANFQHDLFNYNDELVRLNGGMLLYKMIDSMNKVINGTLKERKIELYSAHDITVVAMLKALGIYDDKPPTFTSGIIVEMHEKGGEYFIMVLYYLGNPSKLVKVTIPGCSTLCPYKKFIALKAAVIAPGEDPTCPLTTKN